MHPPLQSAKIPLGGELLVVKGNNSTRKVGSGLCPINIQVNLPDVVLPRVSVRIRGEDAGNRGRSYKSGKHVGKPRVEEVISGKLRNHKNDIRGKIPGGRRNRVVSRHPPFFKTGLAPAHQLSVSGVTRGRLQKTEQGVADRNHLSGRGEKCTRCESGNADEDVRIVLFNSAESPGECDYQLNLSRGKSWTPSKEADF